MKVGFLITARLKSTRLPLKLLFDLNGKTVIERVIERCKKVIGISEVILCTSHNPQDKPLVDIAKRNDIYYYVGNEQDVLQRLSDAAKFFDLDYIINITGENPLFSISHANLVVDQATKGKNDFISIVNLPIGCAVYGLRPDALKIVCEIKQIIDTEIWGPLINRPDIFDVHNIEVFDFYKRPDLRITIDYIEDYRFVNKLFSELNMKFISLESVLSALDENPSLLHIHEHRKQEKISEEMLYRIDSFYSDNKDKIIQIKNKLYENKY